MGISGEFGDGTALVAQLGAMITKDGLDDLIAGFDDAGAESEVLSWLGSGANHAVATGAVERAIGRTRLTAMAQVLGSTPDHVAEALSLVVPDAIDQLTPGGTRPTGAQLDALDLPALLAGNGVDVAALLNA